MKIQKYLPWALAYVLLLGITGIAGPRLVGLGGGSSGAVSSIAAFGSSPNTAGGSVSGGVLTLQPADATRPGGVSTATQTLGGAKTFVNDVTVQGALASTTTLAVTSTSTLAAVNVSGKVTNSIAAGSVATSHTNDSYDCWNSDNSCLRYNSGIGAFTFSGSVDSSSNNSVDLGSASLKWRNLWLGSQLEMSATDSSASPGAATANTPVGKSALAAGASSAVITNSLATTTSLIFLTNNDVDATCVILKVAPASGSFTVTGTSAAGVATNCTATTKFSWFVVN